MPLFEYDCKDCQHSFELLISASKKAACPSCKSTNLSKKISVFSSPRPGEGSTGSPCFQEGKNMCGECPSTGMGSCPYG